MAFSCGGKSGWIDANGEISDSKVGVNSRNIAFRIPEDWHSELAANAKTMTCTITLSGAMISNESITITLSADETLCAPDVSGVVEDVNAGTVALTGDSALLILGRSDALCTITASGKYGASIVSCSVMLSGATSGTASIPISDGTAMVQAVECGRFVFRATDSRGITGEYLVTMPTVGYIPPTCGPVVKRDDPTSGNATLTVKGVYFAGSFGVAENTLSLRARRSDEEDWTDISDITTDGDSYTAALALTNLDYRQSFEFAVQVSDALSGWGEKIATVGPGLPIADWGEGDFNFNVPVFFSGGLDLSKSEGMINIPGAVISGTIDGESVKLINIPAGNLIGAIDGQTVTFRSVPTSALDGEISTSKLTGTISTDLLPSISADKLTGTIAAARLPDIPASKLTGTISADLLPTIPASKLDVGVWTSLALADGISATDTNYGRYKGCAYRVVGDHVYVAFSVSLTYAGKSLTINSDMIPSEYRPARNVYAMCATGGIKIARAVVTSYGAILVDWVQELYSGTITASAEVSWLVGYVDYWLS